jgi:putative tryptophan/tyrosine transport system substrate-binding protein
VQALGDNGFVEGKNMVLERRAADGRPDRALALAAELVGMRVDVILALGTDAALAAKAATKTIPIVMLGAADPVAHGLAVSLARPGGNVTGLSGFNNELQVKRLELLKAAAPKAVRVAYLHEDFIRQFGAAAADAVRRKMDAAAKALGISLVWIVMDSSQDFRAATAAMLREHVDAIVPTADATAYSVAKPLAEFAIQQRLPLLVANRSTITGGALMSYGADISDMYRKAAAYVAKILNGANPADLPIEQPTKVELVINLKTAKAIELTIPQSLLLRADEIIQ